MRVYADGFSFDFTDALDAFVFDEKDKTKPTYHGQPMKAVDIVAEFEDAYVFVEMKDFDNPAAYDTASFTTEDELSAKRAGFKWLKTISNTNIGTPISFAMQNRRSTSQFITSAC